MLTIKKMIIKNGHVVDPGTGTDGIKNVFVSDGRIAAVTDDESLPGFEDADTLDASGLFVFPGFIDLHVHFREPGFTYKETVQTGARAAEAGGFTTVCVMPNTKPVVDTPEKIKEQLELAAYASKIRILPIGAITKGQEGLELTDIRGMAEAGACAISEDGRSVMDAELMERAMTIAKECSIPIFDHCEDAGKVNGGVINAGKKAAELGLPGIADSVEETIEERDIKIAEKAGAALHLCHCTTKGAAALIENGKRNNPRLSAETCPHYFALSEDDIPGDIGNFKMNPPLRSEEDRTAVKEAVTKGIMDVISTDHAPHSREEKEQSFLKAPFGIVGLETSFAVSYTELVKNGELTLSELINRMSKRPAEILNIPAGTLKKGNYADITVCELEKSYVTDPETFLSKGRNTPFAGRTVFGRIITTIAGGEIVYDRKTDR